MDVEDVVRSAVADGQGVDVMSLNVREVLDARRDPDDSLPSDVAMRIRNR